MTTTLSVPRTWFREESATKADAKVPEDEDDDLDKLLQQYEAEAEEDWRKVQVVAEEKPASQMGMAELREAGMAKPISSDTKYPAVLSPLGRLMHVSTSGTKFDPMHACTGASSCSPRWDIRRGRALGGL